MSEEEDASNVSDDEEFVAQFFTSTENSNKKRPVLKSKENTFKPKFTCRKKILRKLKKYKLRKDGQDDPDVLDVSKNLSASLNVIYNVHNNNSDEIIDKWRINYLTKMAKNTSKSLQRRKHDGYDGKNEDKKVKSVKNATSAEPMNTSPVILVDVDNYIEANETGDASQKEMKMNAFMLMMGARNKSIGSNSIGKDRTEEHSEDVKVRRHLKLKRSLALEKMAREKGSHKSQQLEVMRDEEIKLKMEMRAVRLKKMIDSSPKNSADKKDHNDENCNNLNKASVSKRPRQSKSEPKEQSKRLKVELVDENDDDIIIVEIEAEPLQIINKNLSIDKISDESPRAIKSLSKADAEFLSKLSPSIKKKESVLSYFNTVEKINGESEEEDCDVPSDNVIKVKFTPKSKKKSRKRKTPVSEALQSKEEPKVEDENNSLGKQNKSSKEEKRNNGNMNTYVLDVTLGDTDYITATEGMKEESRDYRLDKKKKTKLKSEQTDEIEIGNQQQEHNESVVERRSSRIKRKPSKYQCVDSFDEGKEHEQPDKFIAAKFKRNSVSRLKLKGATEKDQYKPIEKKKNLDLVVQPKKIAPIFANKSEIEAKKKFLQSGIPDQLKKIIEKQKSIDSESISFNAVCHIQQKSSEKDDFSPWDLEAAQLDFKIEDEETQSFTREFTLKLRLDKLSEDASCDVSKSSIDYISKLQEMKKSYPKFPVYRIFKRLKKKYKIRSITDADADKSDGSVDIENLLENPDGDPKTALWCDKFRPTSADDIIGNFEAVTSLNSWLTNWRDLIIEGRSQRMRTRSESSDSSDFYYSSDSDSRDGRRTFNNVLVVTGPTGCGKTSAIYAVARELAMKVIEVNTSSKRTGKIILSSLQEATQSHKVNREATSGENSQNSREMSSSKTKKKSQFLKTYSKKHNSQRVVKDEPTINSENLRTGISLILVEDADIVFEQDDGFVSALHQIIQTSKRPVILVTSSLTVPHVYKYVNNDNLIRFHHLMPKMLGMWLDLMCLAENGDVWPNTGQKLLEFYVGDIRKSINALQFWFARDKQVEETDSENPVIEEQDKLVDETSPGSLTDQDQQEPKQIHNESEHHNVTLFKTFINVHDHDIGITKSILQFPVNNLNLWCNIPQTFNLHNPTKSTDCLENVRCLKSLTRLIDSVAFSDVLSTKLRPSLEASIVSRPWRTKPGDCVSESVNMESYSRLASSGESVEYSMLTLSVESAQKAFRLDQMHVDYTLPGYTQIRSRDKILARHKGLTDAIPLSCQLDRTGVALDYFSAYREICRQEKEKSDNNSKRNNRFCHYLRSVKVTSSGETLELLCDSLNSTKDC